MSKLNKVLSNESAFMALGYVPMLQMFHVEIIEEKFFYSNVTNDLCLIVDDEGLLKSGNLVYEIKLKEATHQIAQFQ